MIYRASVQKYESLHKCSYFYSTIFSDVESTNIIGAVFGVVMFLLTFILHVTVHLKCRSTSPSQSPEISKISSLQEEDDIYIKNTSELFSFLFPERKHAVYLIIDPLLYGMLCGLTFIVTSPFNLDLIDYPTGGWTFSQTTVKNS